MIFKKANFAIALALISLNITAATFTSNSATFGDWDIGGNPGAGDDIVINHDWSGNDAGTLGSWRANYTGTLTINSGGYFQIDQGFTNFTGTIDVQSGGTYHLSGAAAFNGGAVNIDGHCYIGGDLLNDVAVTGSGSLNYGTLNGASTGSVAGTITLPVELISFSGKKNSDAVLLNWITASEVNNDYFEIQVSIDGVSFETIGLVRGNGNTSEVMRYDFSIKNSVAKYFRLKQVDYNGAFEYSHVISLNSSESKLKIVQKGTSNEYFVLTEEKEKYLLTVVGLDGKIVSKTTIEGSEGGRFNYTLPTKGLFTISVSNGNEITSKKSIVR